MNLMAMTLLNTAKLEHQYNWFDPQPLLDQFHEDAINQFLWLAQNGYIETDRFMVRVKKRPTM